MAELRASVCRPHLEWQGSRTLCGTQWEDCVTKAVGEGVPHTAAFISDGVICCC